MNAVPGIFSRRGDSLDQMGRLAAIESRRFETLGRRLQALWVVLSFIALIATSGPHLIHHLPDLYPHQDHHDHDDHHTQSQQTDCLILFLMQHTPLTQGSGYLPPVPLLWNGQVVIDPTRYFPNNLSHVFQARAPPQSPLIHTLLSL
jgi:hypothetical protein